MERWRGEEGKEVPKRMDGWMDGRTVDWGLAVIGDKMSRRLLKWCEEWRCEKQKCGREKNEK